MSDLIVRFNGKSELVIYRHRTNQAVFLTPLEFQTLLVAMNMRRATGALQTPRILGAAIPGLPFAEEIGAATSETRPQEFHRKIVVSPRGKYNVGCIQPSLFDCRD